MRRSVTALLTLCCLATVAVGRSGGDTPVTPPPVVPPAVPADLTVSSGVDQEAAPGAAVTVAPTVTVTTASGAPVPIAVAFAAARDDGNVRETSRL